MILEDAIRILNLRAGASPSQAKAAFRKMALKWHPDRNPDPKASARFKECLEAYRYLVATQTSTVGDFTLPTVLNLDDIFDDIFGFTSADRILGYKPPQTIELSLAQIVHGDTLKLKVKAYKTCTDCGGGGASFGRSVLCTHCFGSGVLQVMECQKICDRCLGRGRAIEHACVSCDGFGRLEVHRLQQIKIPSGTLPGNTYTFHSLDIENGRSLDVYAHVQFLGHPVFVVENTTLLCDYPVTLEVAKNGGVVEVPSYWGWVSVKIPSDTSEGDWVILPAHGLSLRPGTPDMRDGSQRGDLKIRIRILTDKKKRRFINRMTDQLAGECPQYSKRSLWQRLWT